MAVEGNKVAGILQTLRAQLLADKKKTAALGVLFLVLLVVAGRAFWPTGAAESASALVPAATATADGAADGGSSEVDPAEGGRAASGGIGAKVQPVSQPVQSAVANKAVSARVQGAEADRRIASASPSQGEADAAEAKFLAEPDVDVSGLSRRPARDIFAPRDWSMFEEAILAEAAVLPDAAAQESPPREGFWTRWAESIGEYQRERREEIGVINEAFRNLQLRSTVTGQDSLAHISGQVVRRGDTILGFSVVRIEDRRVTLRRSGVQRVLELP